jgi:hypothetical protein
MELNYKRFPILVWLFTIVIGAFLLVAYEVIIRSGVNAVLSWYELLFFSTIYGGILSIPATIVYLLAFNFFAKIISSDLCFKWVMILFTVLALIVTFMFLSAKLSIILNYTIVYALANVAATFLLRFNR